MPLKVKLVIEGFHFFLAIKEGHVWYRLEYALGGASGFSSSKSNKSSTVADVTFAQTTEPSQVRAILDLGETNRSIADIVNYAYDEAGFHNSEYSLNCHNCRHFCAAICTFMGLHEVYVRKTLWRLFWFARS